AGIEMTAHLALQVLDCLSRRVPAATDIAEHLLRNTAAIKTPGEHGIKRLVRDLGECVPQRHFDGADGDRTLGMPAGFLSPHHAAENLRRIEITAGVA